MYINKEDDLFLINSNTPENLNKLYTKYSTIINGIFFSKTRDSEKSLDMTQDVLIKIHKNLDKFNKNKPFNRWVYQIAMNHLTDQHRNLKFLKQKSEYNQLSIDNEKIYDEFICEEKITSNIDDEDNLVDNIKNNYLKDELDKFIFDLYFNKNQSFYEISQTTNMSRNNVESRLNKIISNIKSMNLELLTI